MLDTATKRRIDTARDILVGKGSLNQFAAGANSNER